MNKGDIVLVAFPFTDIRGEKRRPAIVMGRSADHVVLLFVTSQKTGDPSWHVLVRPTKGTGLTLASIVRCDKLTSLDVRTIRGELGSLNPGTLKNIDARM